MQSRNDEALPQRAPAGKKSLPAHLGDTLAGMAPANPAMVMSTGIVAVALHNAGFGGPAAFLALLCALLFAVNMLLLLLRITTVPHRVWADFSNQARGPGFLTLVAATDVLGVCCVLIFRSSLAAGALFRFGVLLWPALISLVFFALMVGSDKMPLTKGAHGVWLLATVSAESLVVLGSLLVEKPAGDPPALLALLMLFVLGLALYFMIMPILLYRLFFKELTPQDLSASFWINAGAMAISCLAGVKLASLLAASPELAALAPAVKLCAASAWGLAVFWLPCLLLLGLWRHVIMRYPFRYGVEYWSMVFPLGMFTVSSQALRELYPFWFALPAQAGLLAATAAWGMVFVSFCLYLIKLLRQTSAGQEKQV